MRTTIGITTLGLCLTVSAYACGGSDNSVLDGGNDGTTNSDTNQPADTGNQQDTSNDTSTPCTDLKCARDPNTTISGVVYDPAGIRTIYNAIVYVPYVTPDPITNGASCDRCGSVSGQPLTTAVTDARGVFKLKNAPVGTNIPLVIQIGKWRRQVVIPAVAQGIDNPVTPSLTHLPRKASEGDMPLIALASGCDPIECSLRKYGIDDSEFTTGAGTGHVRIYSETNASTTMVGTTATTTALSLWQSTTDLPKFDIVLNACDCVGGVAKGSGYGNVQQFLDTGGRVIGSHYAFDFYAPPTGPAEFQATAAWGTTNVPTASPVLVDESVPKGTAYASWLTANLGGTSGQAPIDPASLRQDVGATLLATSRFAYDSTVVDGGGASYAKYLSFDTPTVAPDGGTDAALPPSQQCGRAAFLDFHMINAQGFGTTTNTTFPDFCNSAYPIAMADEEYSFEFAFFEIDSCIQDETMAPTAPTPIP